MLILKDQQIRLKIRQIWNQLEVFKTFNNIIFLL
jgi:hypothetical protein